MQVFEVRLKVFLLKDIRLEGLQAKLSLFIDSGLAKNPELLEFHQSNRFKYYCFDSLYPVEKDKVYKKDNIYSLTIRTIDKELAQYFADKLVNDFDEDIKGLTSQLRIIPKKHIDKIYSITPSIMKNDCGYWKHNISIDEFERRFKENLIKKYNYIMKAKIDEDFELYNNIELKNKKPIAVPYKSIRLLGDKLSLNISDNESAQALAYMAIGTGILEMNARGFGFVNYRYL